MLAFRRFFSNIIYIGPRDKTVVSDVWSSKSFRKQFSKVKKMQIIYVELFTEYLDDKVFLYNYNLLLPNKTF